MDETTKLQAAVERVLGLDEEVEASGEATVGGDALEQARAALHAWVDAAKGVVVNPALGRVTVIHGDGRLSTIASPDLPFAISAAGRKTPEA
jgi:hypothetical protein